MAADNAMRCLVDQGTSVHSGQELLVDAFRLGEFDTANANSFVVFQSLAVSEFIHDPVDVQGDPVVAELPLTGEA